MKKRLTIFLTILVTSLQLLAQTEPHASNWKTWFITNGKEFSLKPPASYKQEINEVIAKQQKLDSTSLQQIAFWNAGSPGYRWHDMMSRLWMYDTAYTGALANLLLGVGIYDATIAAWDTKYNQKRPRPFEADARIKLYGVKPQSPSYPCEYSVAAGVAVTVMSHFYPAMADSVNKMARQLMSSRIASGVAFPSDTRDGFELGKRIALHEIERTKDFANKKVWNNERPNTPGIWNGKKPMFPLAGNNKTIVLTSSSQFRPAPPPDWAKEMEELKNFKQNFRSQSNAFYWANSDFWGETLNKKIFEHNLHLNPPRAARIYAAYAVAAYDGFIACFDAKYAYWGIRPDQYDTTYKSLVPTPPFPGYPSGHALMSGMFSELYSYFFPADRAFFQRKAKEAAESRFQAGIHFRSDNEVGLDLGRKVATAVLQRIKTDGADDSLLKTLVNNTKK